MAMHKLERHAKDCESESFDLVGVRLRDLRALIGGWVGDPGMGDHFPVYEEHAAFFKTRLGIEMDFEANDYYLTVDRVGPRGWLDDDFGDPAVV